MKLKKNSCFYKDCIIMTILLLLTFVLLAVATYIEFFVSNEQDLHQDFWINVLLGTSASSIVSYIVLFIPYKNEKRQEENKFNSMCRKIFTKYSCISIVIKTHDSTKIKNHIAELDNLIGDFSVMYNEMNFQSQEFESKADIITKQISKKLINIPEYLDTLDLFLKNTNKYYNDDEIVILSNELYKVFAEYINLAELKIPNFQFQVLQEMNNTLLDNLSEILNGYQSINETKKVIEFRSKIDCCYKTITRDFQIKR